LLVFAVMKNSKDKFNHHINSGSGELHTSEWLGAIIRYLFFLGRKKFDSFYTEKQLLLNALIGWLFKLILLFGGIYLILLYLESSM